MEEISLRDQEFTFNRSDFLSMVNQNKINQLPLLEKILVVGNGGRENSLAWALAKGIGIQKVFVAPGNAGTEDQQGCERLNIKVEDHPLLLDQCNSLQIDLIVIGPEAPLAEGLADKLRDAGLIVFGPSAEGAQLEASKEWAKTVMNESGVPTAKFWSIDSEEEASRILDEYQQPLVVKADGLASGKGVSVCENLKETREAIKEIFEGKFGAAGKKILLEEKLNGPEVSIFALCDGEKLVVLPPAQDHKRLLEGDKGPNTGGMGAYVPAPLINENDLNEIKSKILEPTLNELIKRGIDYRGVIYAGLMMTADGPKVIEFNCRFGDPECQALMPLMGNQLGKVLQACALGELDKAPTLTFNKECSACVVAAVKGYPQQPRKGDLIKISLKQTNSLQIFHAGTEINEEKDIICAGGRVLSVVAQGENFNDAFNLIYEGMKQINFEGIQYRRDIGYQVRETTKINNN